MERDDADVAHCTGPTICGQARPTSCSHVLWIMRRRCEKRCAESIVDLEVDACVGPKGSNSL